MGYTTNIKVGDIVYDIEPNKGLVTCKMELVKDDGKIKYFKWLNTDEMERIAYAQEEDGTITFSSTNTFWIKD